MHLPSFSYFTTKIYASVHPVVEKSFHSHLDNTMSHRSHICFADVYELNTYFKASDGGLFVMQKIISSIKEIYISHHSMLNFEQKQED